MITVSQNNKSLYQTIQDALEVCEPGEIISIEPGVYKESLTIDKDVQLIGNGETHEIIVETEEHTCVSVLARNAKISNMTIRGTGDLNHFGMRVEMGCVHVSNCAFSSTGTAVQVNNEGTSPIFDKCFFHNSHIGLEIRDGSQGKLESCEVTINQKGIIIATGAAPIIENSKITSNIHNLNLQKQGIGIVYRCLVSEGVTGITVQNNSHLNIIESTIESNEQHNISVDTSTIQSKNCTLLSSNIGLYLKDSRESKVEETTFVNHINAGITLEKENQVRILKCNIEGGDCAVCFQKQSTGVLEDCTIQTSILSGIAILENSNPIIINCQVKDGQGVGLYVKDGRGAVKNSSFLHHSYLNIFKEGYNTTVIENCLFTEEREEEETIHSEPVIIEEKSVRNGESLDQILEELNSYIGLNEVKDRISDLIDFIFYTNERKKVGIQTTDSIRHHCIFLGKPGTGKTTIARLMSKIFYQLGVIEKDLLVEVDRKDLVGEYIGQTSVKTNKIMKKAKGGVLFIDEAYTLVKPETKNDFGQEALDLILKKMEDDNSFIVIAAGYPEEMEFFLNANPGLKDRFSNHFYFEDYSPPELVQILEKMLREEEYSLSELAKNSILHTFTELYRKRDQSFSNARMVRKFFEELKIIHAKRCIQLKESDRTKEVLTSILEDDVKQVVEKEKEIKSTQIPVDEERVTELLRELHSLIGLAQVKREVEQIIKLVRYYKEEGLDYTGKFAPHTVFLGNPGTGKTTVARLLSQLYEALGILPVGDLIETSREDLVAGYVGQTALKTTAILNRAVGSTLFIDEAHTLTKKDSPNDFGQEAVDTILKRMEDMRGKFHLVVAGYTEEMQTFLKSNPGLASRFGHVILFEDYTPRDMVKIAEKFIVDEGFAMGEGLQERLLAFFEQAYEKRDRYFSNARFVRTMIEIAIRQASLRLADVPKEIRDGQKIVVADDFYQFV